MRLKLFSFLAFYLLLLSNVQAAENYEITAEKIHRYVNFLSSDALQGRLTGTQGEKLATQYVAMQFQQLGLIPAGDNGTYFQEFDFNAGVSLGKSNAFVITNQKNIPKKLILNQDWRPLAFSDNAVFSATEFVFANYGITAPDYDSYKNLNVKNKWVIVYRFVPENISKAQSQQLAQYASLRHKAFTAKEHGARGIIFVNPKLPQELIPFSADTSLTGSGIIALSVKSNLLKDLLASQKLTGQTDIKTTLKHGRNVLAKLVVRDNATGMIVIGAHVDHLGHGELSGSRARANEKGLVHPGADDNASGVASVLEVAAKLSDLKAQGKLHGTKDILLAAWSGEEFGILGSSHFVKNFPPHTLHTNIDAAINLDMVGHLHKKLVLQGIGSSPDWLPLLKQIHTIPFITQNDPYLPTDSTAFYLVGVPTINFFTGAQDDYHTPRDKANTLNYAGIKGISEFLVELVCAMENKSNAISYREVPATNNKVERDFKIYLGTIPDYASSDVIGVKLSGVAKNSPAELAGLKQNDVITALAGQKIHDIYDYTYALNALQVNTPVKIVVLRNQEQVVLTITARYRG